MAAATGAVIASYRVAECRGGSGPGAGAGETFDAVGAEMTSTPANARLTKGKSFKERLEEMEEAEQVEDHKALDMEKPFTFLLVITSACVAFVHGANDVANSAGPFAAILEGASDKGAARPDVPYRSRKCCWAGILSQDPVAGERTISTVSSKITALSPSKAFAVQLGAALAVLTASRSWSCRSRPRTAWPGPSLAPAWRRRCSTAPRRWIPRCWAASS